MRRFTEGDEIEIRKYYRAGMDVAEAAAKLGCAAKTIRTRYQQLRGYSLRTYQPVKRQPKMPGPRKPLINENRFYRSNFEPS